MTTNIEPLAGSLGGNGSVETIIRGAVEGFYGLPDGAADAVRAFNRVSQMWQESRGTKPTDKDSIRTVASAVVASLLAGQEPADAGDSMLAAEQEQRKAELRYKALADAKNLAGSGVESLLSEHALVPVLRLALEAVLAEARTLPADTPTNAEAALEADEAGAAAYRTLKTLADRHQAIRRAQAMCRKGQAQGRTDGLFFDTMQAPDMTDTRPVVGTVVHPAGPRDPLARLLWLAGDGQGWLPTQAEEFAVTEAWRGPSAQRTPHFTTDYPFSY